MKRGIAIIISGICLLLLPSTVFAGKAVGTDTDMDTLLCQRDSFLRESLLLYFRFDRSLIDGSYMDNGKTLGAFHALLSNGTAVSLIDTVFITAYASPEGDKAHNIRLAEWRADAVKHYLSEKYPALEHQRILTDPQGENWTGLRNMIEEDDSVPDREEVLMILDYVKDLNRCKELLKRLNCGYAYTYIQDRILPQLRNATVCTVQMKDIKGIALLEVIKKEEAALCAETKGFSPQQADHFQRFCQAHASLPVHVSRRPLFALKTNLLFDAALMPNIEIELPIGKRWSLNGEYMFPWWRIDSDKYCLQVLSGGLEGRYWLGRRSHREVLTGHFLGLYAGGGKYDLQWKEKGYQGEFFIAAGLSYGWAHRIARNLHLEFSIGIGLLRTDYRHYRTRDNYQTLLWQENGNYTWLGPTKVKVSFVWLLTRRKTVDNK